MKRTLVAAGIAAGLTGMMMGVALSSGDFGSTRDGLLQSKTQSLFGVNAALATSSTVSADPAAASVDARKLVRLAKGLTAHVVTQGVAAPNVDMIGLWPDASTPTHLIFCNEQEDADPGVQRLDLATGDVDTIVTGTLDCDPVHVTPWHTVVFGEEAGGGATGGQLFEMIDPIHTTGVLFDRTTGTFTDGPGGEGANHIVARTALGRLSFEGVGLLPNGVAYYGDENRPTDGAPGGPYFKFVPTTLRDPNAGPITNLSASPLASGSIYGLRLGARSGNTDYGQGTELGRGVWVPVPAASPLDLRAATATLKLTGYYRPEDLAFDGAALAAGNVRFCGNNTGNEGTALWGNTVCLTDGSIAQAGLNTAIPAVQLFVVGNSQFAMMDNVAYQPGRGNWVIHEDGDNVATGRNNDLWDCLPDGVDDDTLSDGCIRVATVNDLGPVGTASEGEGAEWTGGVFDASGTHLYVSIQHNMTGYGVILDITGWK